MHELYTIHWSLSAVSRRSVDRGRRGGGGGGEVITVSILK